MVPKYVLHYFDLKGRGEGIRYIFYYKNVDFTDHRISKSEWPAMRSQMPAGQMPVLEVDGKKLSQSVAIARYLGNELGLAPSGGIFGGSSAWDSAKLDEAAHSADEITKVITPWRKEEDEKKKAALLKELQSETLPVKINALARLLNISETHPYILSGDKPTWADLFIAAILERADTAVLGHQLANINKTMADYVCRVQSLDGVREYIAKRTPNEL